MVITLNSLEKTLTIETSATKKVELCTDGTTESMIDWKTKQFAFVYLRSGVHSFLLLPAALRLFTWITAGSEFKIFFLLLFSASANWACPASTRLFGRLSAKYPYAVDKEFIKMHDRHILYFELYVANSFIAQNRIHFKTRKKRVFPGFFSQLPETRVLKFCPELETLCWSVLLLSVMDMCKPGLRRRSPEPRSRSCF